MYLPCRNVGDDRESKTAGLSDDALRGRPKMIPCAFCGASRADQVHTSYYTEDEEPLCVSCWEAAYEKDGVVEYD